MDCLVNTDKNVYTFKINREQTRTAFWFGTPRPKRYTYMQIMCPKNCDAHFMQLVINAFNRLSAQVDVLAVTINVVIIMRVDQMMRFDTDLATYPKGGGRGGGGGEGGRGGGGGGGGGEGGGGGRGGTQAVGMLVFHRNARK